MLDLKYQTHYLFTLLSHTYIIISDFDGKRECKLLYYIFCKYITQTMWRLCLAYKTSKAIMYFYIKFRFFYVVLQIAILQKKLRTLSFYNNEPSKNKHFLILLSSLARNSWEHKLKRIFEIP